MVRFHRTSAFACAALLCLVTVARADDQNSMSRASLNDIPQAARQGLEKQTSGSDNVTVYHRVIDGKDFYTAFFDREGKRMEVRVDPKGNVVSQAHEAEHEPSIGSSNDYERVKIEEKDLPEAVRKSAEKETRDGKDIIYYRLEREGKDLYSIQYTPETGPRTDVRINQSGDITARHDTIHQPSDRLASETTSDQAEDKAQQASAKAKPAETPASATEEAARQNAELVAVVKQSKLEPVSTSDMPDAVLTALREQVRNAADIHYYRGFNDKGVRENYVALFRNADGTLLQVQLDANGKVVKNVAPAKAK